MKLDERDKQRPSSMTDAKRALDNSNDGEIIEALMDSEVAVQNLRKMVDHKGLVSSHEKIDDREFHVRITAKGRETGGTEDPKSQSSEGAVDGPMKENNSLEDTACQPDNRRKGMVAVTSPNLVGQGNKTLDGVLMKGFIYVLTQQDNLSGAVLLYNSGAYLSCEGFDNLEDLEELKVQGMKILTCGACLSHYGLGDKLRMSGVINTYEIVERMTGARLLVRP